MKKILIFGGTGQCGTHLVRKLTKNNYRVTVVTRNIHEKGHKIKIMGNAGYIDLVEASIFDEEKLRKLFEESDICINFVGILFEKKRGSTFKNIHSLFPALLAKLCKEYKLDKLIHLSALGIEDAKESNYALSKLEGEKNILNNFPKSTILRPSLVYSNSSDNFSTNFMTLLSRLPIFPLYYGFLFLMGAVLLLQPLSEDWGSDVGRFFYHSVYLQNWFSPASDGFWLLLSHTWSLAIEEQFYLLWPLIFWFLYKRSYVSTIGFCLVLIIISMYLRFDLAERGYHNFAYRATISHFDSIAMGALCSLLFCKYGQVFSRFKLILSLVALLSIAVFLLCLFSYDLKKSHLFLISNGLTFMNVAYICVFMLLLISSSENVVKKFLAKPFFIFTARISYGMYIFHFPICVFISVWVQSLDYEYLYGHFIALTLTLCLSYLVSWLSYKYFEEPILKLKDRYAPVM